MKPGVFSQVYLHFVFSPKGREACLRDEIQEEVFRYISRTLSNKKQKPLKINGMADHIHILVGLNTIVHLPDLVRDIKRSSSLYINERKLVPKKFQWQEGYGVFSYGRSQIPMISNYIANQKHHHRKRNFRNEYIEFLERFEISYDPQYLFEFYD